MNNIEKRVFDLALPIVAQNNAELDSVMLVQEGGIKILRVLIDASGGVNVDMCTSISEALGAIEEIDDMIDGEYYLEVSSLGIERELRNIDEQIKHIGEYVHVSLYHKVCELKEFEGYLKDANQEEFMVEVNLKGRIKTITFKQNDLAKIRLAIKF